MSRKVSGVMAGWLAAASVAVAQSGTPAGSPPPVKGKTLSPYYSTASTVDWSKEGEAPPELLPPVASTPVVPAAPAKSPIQLAGSLLQAPPPATPPAPPPATTLPPTTNTPAPPVAAPAGPATNVVVPAAPADGAAGTSGVCGPNGCAPTCNCGNAGGKTGGILSGNGHVWADPEFLLWWPRGMNVPPLATASPAGTPRSLAGVFGAPTTVALFGNDKVDSDMEPGFRIRAGLWFDDCNTCGIEGSYFFIGTDSTNHAFDCNTAAIIARPFIDVNPGVPNPINAQLASFGSPNSELVCLPGVVNGVINIHASTDLYGFDANFRTNFINECDRRVDLLAGYRYLNLKDDVTVTESLTVLGNSNPGLVQGTTFNLQDRFKSTNEFNGGQIGAYGERRYGRWYMGGRNLIAFGNTHSDISINGFTRVSAPGGAVNTYNGGLLTQPTNIGSYSSDKFAVVWESDMVLGYQVTDNIRAFFSYSWLYWSSVARAGDQIDLVVNSSQIPPGTLNGVARPAFLKHDTEFWAQGISFGLEMKY